MEAPGRTKGHTHTLVLLVRGRGAFQERKYKYVWGGLCLCHIVKLLPRSPNPGDNSQLFYFLTSLWHLVFSLLSFLETRALLLSFGDISRWFPFFLLPILLRFLFGSLFWVLPFKCCHPASSVHWYFSILILVSGQPHPSVPTFLATPPLHVVDSKFGVFNLHFHPFLKRCTCMYMPTWTPLLDVLHTALKYS